MAHLPASKFSHVFEPLQGKKIGFVHPLGNVGDLLIVRATVQLFEHFGIEWRSWKPSEPLGDLQELVFGGGGNMGTVYRSNWELRGTCLETRLPLTILPQSYLGPEERPFHRVFVRERASLQFAPNAILAPELALGLAVETPRPASKSLGIFLRKDQEANDSVPWYSRDPVKLSRCPEQYLRLAARYERLITNRLHLAVAGLLQDRRVTLLPNSYHKNASLYETWLADLGCEFAPTLETALQNIDRGELSWTFQADHYMTASWLRLSNLLRVSAN